jgi:hypothetical protein
VVKFRHIIYVISFCLYAFQGIAQTEAEMKVQADKLFDTDQYLDATPLYLRLLSLQPRDANYNYRYGACLTHNSNNKQEAIRYLSYAVNDPNIAPEAYYFLGKALHLNYQFNDAIKNFTIYIEKKEKSSKQFDAEREIQMCQNGKRLITTISDLVVLDKKEINSDKFFRIYDLSDIGGSLLVTAEFQTKFDKKYNHTPLIHFPQNPSVIYYSSYGENGANGKDIYVRRKLPDGSYGMPQPLQGDVNTKFDEDFPYMHPDGSYLYFSSKGHNSMGGYDVYRSKLDPESTTFGPPENMDFAISSPDDDLFYLVDSMNVNAYFASARQSQDGKLHVYKVKVDRVPLQLAVIKGNFVSEIDPTNKNINFEIFDFSNGENIGKFNSTEKSSYQITFPKGGKYEFVMTVPGSSQEFRSVVSIPFMKEFKPLKQKIIHTTEEGKEVIRIINLFNEEVEDPQSVLAEVIKIRSELNVNVNEFNLDELEEDKRNQQFLKDLGFDALALNEISVKLLDDVQKIRDDKKNIEEINNNINSIVVQNTEDFNRLEEQIKNKVAETNNAKTPESKYIFLKESQQLIKKQSDLKQNSKDLLRLSDSINGVLAASAAASSLGEMTVVADKFEQLYKEGKEKEAIAYLVQNRELVAKSMKDESIDLTQNLVDRVVKIDEEITTLNNKIDAYSRELKEVEIAIQSLENTRATAKSKDLAEIDSKIAAKREEASLILGEKRRLEKRVEVLTNEKYLLNRQIAIIQNASENKTDERVSRDTANRSLKETEKTNTNTLTNFVNSQIEDLERNDPSLKERVVFNSGLKGDNILAEHKTLQTRIEGNKELSREVQLQKLISNAGGTLRSLNDRLTDVEKAIENNKFDDKLNKEKQLITKGIQDVNQELDRYETELASLTQSSIADVTEENIQKEIDPTYDNKIENIRNNNSLTEEQLLTEQQKVDEAYIAEAKNLIAANEKALIAKPNDKNLQQRQKVLSELKDQTEKVVTERFSQIEAKQQNKLVVTSKEGALKAIDPEYSARKETIKSDNNLPKIERFTAIAKEEEQLLNRIDTRLVDLEKQQKNDPTNKKITDEIKAFRTLKNEVTSSLANTKNEITKLENAEPSSTITRNEILATVDDGYEARLSRIKSDRQLAEKQKIETLIREEQQLLSKIDKRTLELEKQLKAEPNNKRIQEELKALKELRTETATELSTNREELTRLESSPEVSAVDKEKVIANVDNEYENRVKSIQNNPSLGTDEKNKALLSEEKALVDKVSDRIVELKEQLDNDPNNDAIKTELSSLEAIEKEKTQSIDQKEANLAVKSSGITSEQLLTEIAPDFTSEIAVIENNNNLSENEKLTKVQLKDKALLSKIDTEIVKVIAQLKKDPNNSVAKERKEKLEELKAIVESRVDEREQEIANAASSNLTQEQLAERKANVLKEVDASYTDKKESLLAKQPTPDYNQLIALEEKLLVKLEAEKKNIQKVLAKDPLNKDFNLSMQLLENLIQETKDASENWKELKVGKTPLVISKEEKNTLLTEINADYAKEKERVEDVKSENKQTGLSEELQLERSLNADIRERIAANERVLAEEPNNKILARELEVLNELKQENEADIQFIEKELNALPIVKNSFTEKQLTEKITQLDPEYLDKVSSIESNNDLTDKARFEELNRIDRTLLNDVFAAIERIDEALSTNPTDNSLKFEKDLLEQTAQRLEQTIDEREKEISLISDEPAVTTELKNKFIDQLDANYRKEITAIEQNNSFETKVKAAKFLQEEEALLTKIEDRLNILELSEPLSGDLKTEKEALQQIRKELVSSIEKHKDQLNGSAVSSEVKMSDKKEVIENLLPNYYDDKEQIQADNTSTPEEKTAIQLELEEKVLDLTEQKLREVQNELKANPSGEQLKFEENVLAEVITDVKKEIESLSTETTVAGRTLEQVSADVLPDYASRKEVLEQSKMEESKKVEGLVKLERELLSKLEAEKKAIEKQLLKNPTDQALQQKVSDIEKAIAEQKRVVAAIEKRQSELVSDLAVEKALNTADAAYNENIKAIQEGNSQTKGNDLAEREAVHQERIQQQIEANDKTLAKKESNELSAVNEALKAEVAESKVREENYRSGNVESNPIESNPIAQEQFVNNLREELLDEGNIAILTSTETTINSLKKQDQQLAAYEEKLKQEIASLSNEIKQNPTDLNAKEELSWVNEEIAVVEKKRRQVSVSIGELEMEFVAGTTSEKRVTSPEIDKLSTEAALLEKELESTTLSATERKSKEKELMQNRVVQEKLENELLTDYVQEKNSSTTNELSALVAESSTVKGSDEKVRMVGAQVSNDLKEAQELNKSAEATKNPSEKNYLLNQAAEKQEEAETIAAQARYENALSKIEQENGISSLQSRSDLESKQRRFSVEVGELTSEIMALDDEIAQAKTKDQPALIAEKKSKEEERKLVQKQLDAVNEELAAIKERSSIFTPESKNVSLTFNDERNIAASETYLEYVKKANQVIKVEDQMLRLESEQATLQNEIRTLVSEDVKNPSATNKELILEKAAQLKQIEEELLILANERTQKQVLADAVLPQNTEEAMKIQNLVQRGIAPINKVAVAAALVAMPSNGLDIKEVGAGIYTAANPIPVDVKVPTGLVYRVQVGAFAKPIPQDLFKEFNPVSGEKLTNGITRYLAGYFNNSAKVVDVRDQIKALGYKDAFAVAYCDGVRITIAEARILEANGQCKAKGENELIMEIAANTAIKMGLEDTTKVRKVPEITYNQAPGAVKAEPIETRKGLFFTVQIGVYNKPANATALHNLDPYMTLRLPNGQIRYSTGIFHSVEEARARKLEAINKGVTDAFITAYFNGERIGVNDAIKMLEEQGTAILEPKVKDTNIVNPVNVVNPVQPVSTVTVETIEPKQAEKYFQIVTKKTFEEFPKEVLNRYNSHGSFYFDEKDGKVKSAVADSDSDLPQVFYFKDDIDTLIFNSISEFSDGTILSLNFVENKLPGDCIDWLLKLNYRKEYIQSEEGIRMLIHGVPEDKIEAIKKEAEKFGLTVSFFDAEELNKDIEK